MSLTPEEIRKRADTEHWALNRYHARELAYELERLQKENEQWAQMEEAIRYDNPSYGSGPLATAALVALYKLRMVGAEKERDTYRKVLIEAAEFLEAIKPHRHKLWDDSLIDQSINTLTRIRALKLEENK